MVEKISFMYITNDPIIAATIQECGVQRIWIDLEYMGKEERQKNMNTVKSKHSLVDISRIKPVIKDSELLVRVNPIHTYSKEEIDEVIDRGADVIMLPMFKTVQEVKKFLEIVDRRIKTVLLFETKESVEYIHEIMNLGGFDEVHVGLNDLHLSYGLNFMFELLSNGTVEYLCKIFKSYKIPFGFGGIAKIGEGLLPAEKILAEHIRLGSTRIILSRSFCDVAPENIDSWKREFKDGIIAIRQAEKKIKNWNKYQFQKNIIEVKGGVERVVKIINDKRNG